MKKNSISDLFLQLSDAIKDALPPLKKKATTTSSKAPKVAPVSSDKEGKPTKAIKKVPSSQENPAQWEVKEVLINTKSLVRIGVFALLFAFIGYLGFLSLDIIYLIITSCIISIAMEGMILSIEKRVKSRSLAIGIGYLLLFIFLLSGFFLLVPFFLSQLTLGVNLLSEWMLKIKEMLINNDFPDLIQAATRIPDFIKYFLLENYSWIAGDDIKQTLFTHINALIEYSAGYIKQISAAFFVFVGNFFLALGRISVIFLLAVFLTIEKKYFINLIISNVSATKKLVMKAKIDRVYDQLAIWFRARLILSLFILVAVYLSFWILRLFGIELPSILSLSFMAGLLDIIPYVGPFLAAIPIMILAIIHNGFWGMVIVLGVFFFIQWIQNSIVVPVLMEKKLGINAVLIFVCALFGATIMGFWGIVLSVPLAVVIWLFIEDSEK